MKPAEEFSSGQNKDRDCKKALNCLYNAAERQSQLDWYYEATGSPAMMKKVMHEYFKLHPKKSKESRAPQVRLLQMKESVRASQMVDTDVIGEMMHVDHFIYWAGKKKNLAMPEEEAKVLGSQHLCSYTPFATTTIATTITPTHPHHRWRRRCGAQLPQLPRCCSKS